MSHRPCHFSPVISYAGIDKRYTRKYNKQVSHPPPFGPVAQLGAHHIRIVGVVGSNPIRSTKKSKRFRLLFFYQNLILPDYLANFLFFAIMTEKRGHIYDRKSMSALRESH